jgi:hypothetical protein
VGEGAGAAIRAWVGPLVDTALAAVAAVVFTVCDTFARRHVLAEARRHLVDDLGGADVSWIVGLVVATILYLGQTKLA